MANELSIFLSHKLGVFAKNARTVAGNLALFGGNDIKVIYSADFERGTEWEPRIREGLARAHWLVLLYTGPHLDWDWCMFEAGYFRALMEDTSIQRRLICLHDPAYPVPAPLQGFGPMPATQDEVLKLYKDIYLKDPWKLKPGIFEDNPDEVRDAVKRVCDACRFPAGPIDSLQIAPSINIRVKKSALAELEAGKIPSSSPVTGEGAWETVFGKPGGTAGWTWGDLTQGVVQTSAWEYQIANMMAEAIKRRAVQYPCIAVRIAIQGVDGQNEIYRIGLRRMSVYPEDLEFAYVLNRVRAPFEPSADDRETMLYHLFNCAWYFRQRFIERYRQKMKDLGETLESYQRMGRQDEVATELKEAVRSLSLDLRALEADMQVRGLERAAQLRTAFAASEQDNLDRLMRVEFPPLVTRLNEAIRGATPDPREIAAILAAMDPINKWFCERSLKELSEIMHSH